MAEPNHDAAQRLRGILDAMFAFVAVLTPDGNVVEVNDAPLRAMRLSRASIIGTPFIDAPGWAHSAAVREDVRQAIARAAAGESVRLELTVQLAPGHIVAMDTAFAPLRDDRGRVTQVVGSGVDITEQTRVAREMQRLLRQREAIAALGSLALRTDPAVFLDTVTESIASVLETPLCAILELAPDGDSLLMRAGTGWADGLVGHARVGVGHDSQAGYTLFAAAPVIVEDLASETRFSGPPLLVDHGVVSGLSVIINGAGRPFGVLSAHSRTRRLFRVEDVHFVQSVANVVADFVRRTRVEDQLSRNERRYRTLTNATAQVVWVADGAGRNVVVLGDADALERYHQAWTFVDGQPLVHPDDREGLTAAWQQAVTATRRFDFEYRLRSADGHWRNVTASGLPVLDPDGAVEEWVGVVVDITEQRRLQEQLRQAQKMEAVGQLAGGIAHDFNNLLTIICGCGELLDDIVPAAGQARDLLDDVLEAGGRAAALTRQLLAFSRRQILAPAILDVAEVTRAAEKLLRRLIGEDIHLVVAGAAGATARLDAAQIEQVIVNLAINARDAMPQGGTLTIDTHVVDLDAEPGPADATAGRHVLLTVRDTGHGMAPEVRARIFEPFFTTKGPGRGTGLGLATVYGIVKQSGGALAVDSEPGAGTVFRIYLPFVEPPAAAPAGEKGTSLPRGSETILLVEDEAGVRNFARHVLERCGYRVLTATDGLDGIRVATEYDGPIDLLVTDIVMPEAGGRIVAEAMSGLRPGARQLFISGYAADEFLRHGIEESEVAFLAKPFLPHQLAQKVRQVLEAPASPLRPRS